MHSALLSHLTQTIQKHHHVHHDLSKRQLISLILKRKEAIVSASGALATWTPKHSTGRRPKDTFIVDHPSIHAHVDWTSPNNNPMTPALFEELFREGIKRLEGKDQIFVTNRTIGADPTFALPVTLVTDRALPALFSYNMFRPPMKGKQQSIFSQKGFTLLALPFDSAQGKPFDSAQGASDIIIAMDMEQKLGLIFGSHYLGTIKKLLFTVMNFLLPEHTILPLHCAANEDSTGHVSLFLGLSGTGKTTLSTDPHRKLIGDDEHAWSDHGIANYEFGCYAKLIDLNLKKEPEIYSAAFTTRHHLSHGVIVENAMVYPDGTFDLTDDRFTPNSRVSYPISYLSNIKTSAQGGHPKTIIFLTADAYGVLPPIAKLTPSQAMLWFLMGYTSKLAGTETGVVTPTTTFSRFFGEPFMPRIPADYIRLFGEKINAHQTDVYLVNTGWSGGPYGVGHRMDILLTRSILHAALSGALKSEEYQEDKRFHLLIPKHCPGVEDHLLFPKNTWKDKAAFEEKADALATQFARHFERAYGKSNIPLDVANQCPGL